MRGHVWGLRELEESEKRRDTSPHFHTSVDVRNVEKNGCWRETHMTREGSSYALIVEDPGKGGPQAGGVCTHK